MMKGDAIRDTFCRNISRLLVEKDATQKELADAIKVSPATVSSWVQGTKLPRMDKADAICRFFGVPRESLLSAKVNLPADTQRTRAIEAARVAAILRKLQSKINDAFDAAIADVLDGNL